MLCNVVPSFTDTEMHEDDTSPHGMYALSISSIEIEDLTCSGVMHLPMVDENYNQFLKFGNSHGMEEFSEIPNRLNTEYEIVNVITDFNLHELQSHQIDVIDQNNDVTEPCGTQDILSQILDLKQQENESNTVSTLHFIFNSNMPS